MHNQLQEQESEIYWLLISDKKTYNKYNFLLFLIPPFISVS